MDSEFHNDSSSPERPTILSILCIITFAFGIFKIILFSWAAIFLINYTYKCSGLTGMLNALISIKTPVYALVWIAVTLISLIGTWLMWRMQKAGFYLYFFSATLAYVLPASIAGTEMMTIQRLVFSSIFIFFYGINIKFMK